MNIAFITYENVGKYTSSLEDEDGILLSFLKEKGLPITEEKWSDEKVNWADYTHAVLKAPWDYFDRFPLFNKWLNHIEALGITLLNPYEIIRWNSDKHYLKDIGDKGLQITPTQYCEKNTLPNLITFFEFFDADELVIKPTVSGGSKNTFRFNKENVAEVETTIHNLLKEEAFMIQPFLKEIAEEGEWSFLFFNGNYSHSLLKKAKSGDFRVQHYLGGSIHPQSPTEEQITVAKQYVDQFAKGCLYARVDGVYVNGHFNLMELELIEPFLFLFTHPEAYQNYYKALKTMLT
jgi:glutathione synthase/RimK-type ligase-like ATP-grasp enzyme